MSPIEFRIRFLKKLKLFEGVQSKTLRKIALSLSEKKFHNKDIIYFQGEISESLFIIRYGEVLVRVNNQKSIYLGPQEILGEVSVITKMQHSSTASASMDCLLYELKGDLFLDLAETDRNLSRNLISFVSERFRDNLIVSKSSSMPRRLIAHVQMGIGEKFSEEVRKVASVCEEVIVGKTRMISTEEFIGLSREKMIIKLSDLRSKSPVIHVLFKTPDKIYEFENILIQADYILFYEQSIESGWTEKINTFQYLRNSLRNYEGRAIRYFQEKSISYRADVEKEKVYTNREFMARSIMARTRGLTLGGGGARALAHVGLLKVLERNKIQFDYVSGSSMGAVIGALYARGESAENIENFVKKYFGGLDTPFDPTIPLISFYKGRKMKAMLKEIFGDERLEDSKIPFVTSAIDLHAGEEYVFDKGPFWEALLCTMSLPVVFPPVSIGERVLIDGGVLNNVPDDLIRRKGADKILSVNVSPLKDKTFYQLFDDKSISNKSLLRSLWEYIKYPPILKIMGRASMLEGREITKAKVSRMDLFLHFHLEDFNLFDFSLYKDIIDKGESEAEKNFPEIKKLFLPE
ncbi:MAG TPA: patatin-like phospholipase family protein [Leptospiraceae bacterium]|nr:patatin-like phospholipase family protein [Leptospiraceae bacterium]HNK95570.1 patatin-like phospholipase family protein [Leptospiraceae bacterium]HNN81120.1 patatin-like phospholipase family protein [Leptospiraceae bacterium]